MKEGVDFNRQRSKPTLDEPISFLPNPRSPSIGIRRFSRGKAKTLA